VNKKKEAFQPEKSDLTQTQFFRKYYFNLKREKSKKSEKKSQPENYLD